MAHAPSDVRLRRSVIGGAPDPLQHRSGMPTTGHSLSVPIPAGPQGEVGVQGSESFSSTPGAGRSTCSSLNYNDTAVVPKPDRPPPHPGGLPFELKR